MKAIKRNLRVEMLGDRTLLSASPMGEFAAPPLEVQAGVSASTRVAGVLMPNAEAGMGQPFKDWIKASVGAGDTDSIVLRPKWDRIMVSFTPDPAAGEAQRLTVMGTGTFATVEAENEASWPKKLEIGALKAGSSEAHDSQAVEVDFRGFSIDRAV
jgi:hypothetical protein